MPNICIIPARGGSKRIPRKNIRPFLGKPMIAYAIETAHACDLFDEVMVSTDDAEIAEIAKAYGAKVPFIRTEQNADDYATTLDVLLEVIACYEQLNVYFESLCCLYPASPLATVAAIQKGFQLLKEQDYDTVLPIVAYSFPIQRSLELLEGKVRMLHPVHSSTRSQDLATRYHDAGQWYWTRQRTLMTQPSLFSSHTGGVVLSELEVQDIDNETDWKLAELKYELARSKPKYPILS